MQSDSKLSPTKLAKENRYSSKTGTDANETLRLRLAGPSSIKPGQNGVDQAKVNQIIYDASKGSAYFANERKKDADLTKRIDKMKLIIEEIDKTDTRSEIRHIDGLIEQIEKLRDLSQVIVHIDCDSYYASVEELDRPELKEVPMGVGHGVLTTANYKARMHGVRSGMATFIALKLCPNLTIVSNDFSKYIKYAAEIRKVLELYDPNFNPVGLDEAYLNVNAYCRENNINAWDAVQKMRNHVVQETKLTISAGIAPNNLLAKIGSNFNKPNGQFEIGQTKESVLEFMAKLPVRKVHGIGRVLERELIEMGIDTTNQILEKKQYLRKVFGEKTTHFLLKVALGISSNKFDEHKDIQKSIGTESTFGDMSDEHELKAKLRSTAEELANDMLKDSLMGRTLHLKLKKTTYEVLTRQIPLARPIYTSEDLYKYGLQMLQKELPIRIRLMGLKMSNLTSRTIKVPEWLTSAANKKRAMTEVESEAESRVQQASQEDHPRKEQRSDTTDIHNTDCPICFRAVQVDLINSHIDECLNKSAIKEAVKSSFQKKRTKPNS